jgi:hypothetical protein
MATLVMLLATKRRLPYLAGLLVLGMTFVLVGLSLF